MRFPARATSRASTRTDPASWSWGGGFRTSAAPPDADPADCPSSLSNSALHEGATPSAGRGIWGLRQPLTTARFGLRARYRLSVLPRELISAALTETAARLESGYASEIKRREDRLRLAFADALSSHDEVEEARISPEWRPQMPFWPWSADGRSKLGGFDLAIRFSGDESYSLVAELKWTH